MIFAACEYGLLVLGHFGTSTEIHEHRVQVRIGSSTPSAGKVRFKSYFKLSTNCTFVAIRQVKTMIKIPIISNVDLFLMNGVHKRGTVVCKLEL